MLKEKLYGMIDKSTQSVNMCWYDSVFDVFHATVIKMPILHMQSYSIVKCLHKHIEIYSFKVKCLQIQCLMIKLLRHELYAYIYEL